MRADIIPGSKFHDYELSDHTGSERVSNTRQALKAGRQNRWNALSPTRWLGPGIALGTRRSTLFTRCCASVAALEILYN
jgi:hypothetical protein